MLAILSAVSEVIKENRIDETNTDEPSGVEYFGALLTSLDSSDSVESLSATISLLAIVIKTIDKEILHAKFSISSKLLLETLSRHVNSEDASMVRGLLGCLSILLRAQTKETWGYQSTVRVMESILPFVIDGRPKVRKAAQHSVCSILASNRNSDNDTSQPEADFHPVAGKTSEFLIKTIEDNVGKNEKAVLHVLILLKEILHTLPKQHVKRTCDTIVGIMTMGNRLSLSCGFQALYGLFFWEAVVEMFAS
jgi:ribosomal RNA-processing protein 12